MESAAAGLFLPIVQTVRLPHRPRSLAPSRLTLAVVAVLAGVIGSSTPAQAASGTWTNTAGGIWSTATNWSSSIIADGATFTASFNTLDLTASNRTVTIDTTSRTIGTITIGDTSATDNRSYII